jgi:hypothetical protein
VFGFQDNFFQSGFFHEWPPFTFETVKQSFSFKRLFSSISSRGAAGMVEGVFDVQEGEMPQITHDFGPLMAHGESIQSITVTATKVHNSEDLSNFIVIAGSQDYEGQSAMYALFQIERGQRYKIIVSVTTSALIAFGVPRTLVTKHLINGI